jgi:hypothetical protein
VVSARRCLRGLTEIWTAREPAIWLANDSASELGGGARMRWYDDGVVVCVNGIIIRTTIPAQASALPTFVGGLRASEHKLETFVGWMDPAARIGTCDAGQ